MEKFGRSVVGVFAIAEEFAEQRHGDARRVGPRLIRACARGKRGVLVERAWSGAAGHDRR